MRVENAIPLELHPTRKSEVRVAKPTTFKALGIESRLDQRLNLAGEQVIVARMRSPQDDGSVYFAIVQHPFQGEHFAQVLNAVAPYSDDGKKRGILADLSLPDDTRRYEKERGTYDDGSSLHQRHENDPIIGELYQEFDVQNRIAWMEAMKKSSFDAPFISFDSLKAFDSTDVSWLYESIREGAIKSRLVDHHLSFLPRDRQEAVTRIMLESLTPEEQQQFAVRLFIGRDNILVDLQHGDIKKREGGGTKFTIVDPERIDIQVSAWPEMVVEVRARLDDAYRNQWNIESYNFPPEYYETSLYPLIAWSRDQRGARRFLNQQEVAPFLRYPLGMRKAQRDRLDAKFGQVYVAYFSPDAVDLWKTQLPLQDKRERHQRIMGAQVPIWVAHPDNLPMLISDDNPVLPKLESVI